MTRGSYGFTFTVEEGINAISDVIYHLETYDVTTIRAGTPMFLLARKIKAMGVKMVMSGEVCVWPRRTLYAPLSRPPSAPPPSPLLAGRRRDDGRILVLPQGP